MTVPARTEGPGDKPESCLHKQFTTIKRLKPRLPESYTS